MGEELLLGCCSNSGLDRVELFMELLLLEWSTSQMEWSRPPDLFVKVERDEQAEDSVFSTQAEDDDEEEFVSVAEEGRLPELELLLAPDDVVM